MPSSPPEAPTAAAPAAPAAVPAGSRAVAPDAAGGVASGTPASTAAGAAVAALPAYLRALWGLAPRIAPQPPMPGEAAASLRPVLAGFAAPSGAPAPAVPDALAAHPHPHPHLELHLPLHAGCARAPGWPAAAASHAAAHWRHGGPPAPRGGLRPVQQAIYGVLEDARVEALALRGLPGLRTLWLPFHADPGAPRGDGAEALLARLARCLLDPGHADPHPWIARALRVCLDADGRPSLEDAAAVRRAASLLGNDLGQMRLPFTAGGYRVHAAYRDDNRHLWQDAAEAPPSGAPSAGAPAAALDPAPDATAPGREQEARSPPGEDAAPPAPDAAVARYPEWDHRIGRHRPDWCAVFAPPAAPSPVHGTDDAAPSPSASPALVRALRALQGPPAPAGGRAREGEEFHPDGLVEAGIDLRLRRSLDPRIHRARQRAPRRRAVLLLLDASASTGRRPQEPAEGDAAGATLLDRIRAACDRAVRALEAAGHRAAVHAFASYGRQRIEVRCLKDWDEPASAPGFARRLAALRSDGSTRLGAVLRHATALSAQDAARHPGLRRSVVLVTDGEPHDVDVHDPAYLPADLRQAVRAAGRHGIGARCLAVLPEPAARRRLAHGFGPSGCAVLDDLRALPRRLASLMAVAR
jgi:hypothetical protein